MWKLAFTLFFILLNYDHYTFSTAFPFCRRRHLSNTNFYQTHLWNFTSQPLIPINKPQIKSRSHEWRVKFKRRINFRIPCHKTVCFVLPIFIWILGWWIASWNNFVDLKNPEEYFSKELKNPDVKEYILSKRCLTAEPSQ